MSEAASATYQRGRHRFVVALVFAVIGLITAGALVTSKQAGLSVPDWPLSYGSLNPPRWWEIENVRAEHGHRLIAAAVALLTVSLAFWVARAERRRWVRVLAYTAVGTVLVQAVLGGVTVLLFLPTPVSVGHAGLAQLFLGLIVTLAVVSSRWWETSGRESSPAGLNVRVVRNLAMLLSIAIYAQILVGAVMRHSGAGLAIPDFPLAFGRLVPGHWDAAIAVHYAHRVGAVLVALLTIMLFVRILRQCRAESRLLLPAIALMVLVACQIALGAAVVLTGKAVVPNTVHVGTGATIWATSLVLSLHAGRLSHARRSLLPGLRAEAVA